MVKILSRFYLVLASCSAYAQTSATEVAIEPASPLMIDLFVFVFIASIVGFLGYTWWVSKKKGKSGTEE